MKEKKLDALKKSHDDGFITKEEYEREKKNRCMRKEICIKKSSIRR